MKRILPSAAIFLLLLTACSAPTDTAQQPDDGTTLQPLLLKIEYGMIDDAKLVGYLAEVRDGKQHPAVVLIHEQRGVDQSMRERAMDIAREGYTALVVDLYGGQTAESPAQARSLASGVQNDIDGALENVAEAVDYLRRMPSVNGAQIASVGWSFGDNWVSRMARNDLGFDASVIYYEGSPVRGELPRMRADILGQFGEESASIATDDDVEFEATLETQSGSHAFLMYPYASGEEDSQAAESWRRTIDFLERSVR